MSCMSTRCEIEGYQARRGAPRRRRWMSYILYIIYIYYIRPRRGAAHRAVVGAGAAVVAGREERYEPPKVHNLARRVCACVRARVCVCSRARACICTRARAQAQIVIRKTNNAVGKKNNNHSQERHRARGRAALGKRHSGSFLLFPHPALDFTLPCKQILLCRFCFAISLCHAAGGGGRRPWPACAGNARPRDRRRDWTRRGRHGRD